MLPRKEMKKAAKKALRRHYWIFVLLCIISGFIGNQFASSLTVFTSFSTKVSDKVYGSASDGGGVASAPSRLGLSDVVSDIVRGDDEGGREKADQIMQEEAAKDNPVLGRSRGVLSGVVNSVTSGSILVRIASAMNRMIGSNSITVLLLILLGISFVFAAWFFFVNIYSVLLRRIFLEGYGYEKVSVKRVLYLFKVKKWCKASLSMFLVWLYQLLWNLTIIGGIIKRYSYYMVSFIVAENPDIAPKEAIRLSRRMMQGHKWECFVFELSFIGWDILGDLTFGLTSTLFSNPYQIAAFTEYYVNLRHLAKVKELPGSELMNDYYLYQKPDAELRKRVYKDALVAEKIVPDDQKQKGFFRFLAEWFGIIIIYGKHERRYEEICEKQVMVQEHIRAAEGKVYPTRLSPIPEGKKRKWIENVNYMRNYSIWSIVMMFFSFAFIGWIWEVSLHLVSDGEFVNRGVLHGPWLPIYGAGGVLILVILKRLRKYPIAEFIGAVILCGAIEYYTAYFLEIIHDGKKWWDYSGYFLNLDGRICAEGLLTFGLGGVAIVYIVAPLLDNLFRRIKLQILVPVSLILICTFGADQIYSGKHPNAGKGITDYTLNQRENIEFAKSIMYNIHSI